MNWGAPVANGGLGEAVNPPSSLGQPVDTTAAGGGSWAVDEQIATTSNMMVERADNTAFAWDAAISQWVFPTFLVYGSGSPNSITTFAGHFNAPSYESSTSPYGAPSNYYGGVGQFGDPLLGAVANPQAPQADAQMTFDFSQALYGVAFQVSNASGTNTDFIATLDAYDGSGNLIGVYQVNTNGTGDGGACPGLINPLLPPTYSDPSPCNNAPVIQFYDPEGRVKSVVLTVNDTQGLYVDGMYLDVSTPDPGPAPLIGGGLVILALLAKRLNRSQGASRSAKVDGPQV